MDIACAVKEGPDGLVWWKLVIVVRQLALFHHRLDHNPLEGSYQVFWSVLIACKAGGPSSLEQICDTGMEKTV